MLAKLRGIVYNERRKSTHSKADAPEMAYLPISERRLLGIVYNERRKSTHSKADAPEMAYLPLSERRLLRLPTG